MSLRSLLAILAAGALLAVAGCGDDDDGESGDRFTQIPKRTVEAPKDQTAPRWQRIAAFSGRDSSTETVNVSAKALQWRARWRCSAGRFELAVTPRPRAGNARETGSCPGRETAVLASTGRQTLAIDASAAWRLVVEEEVRTPLHERPLAGMRESSPVARGRFYKIDVRGAGRAELYRVSGGRHALRMEGFATEPNPSLVVWVSEASAPRTTREAFDAPHVEVRALKSTLGDQNYLLPSDVEPGRVRSVVVWNKPSRVAYTAATLRR